MVCGVILFIRLIQAPMSMWWWCGLTARDISWRGGAVLKEGTIVEAFKQLVKRGRGILQPVREKVGENGFDGKEQNLERLVS